MARASIGIYISSKFVDIVEVEGTKLSPVISGFVRQEIPPKPLAHTGVLDESIKQHQDRIAVAIKEGLDKLNQKSQFVNTVLPTSDVMVRYFDMPALPKSEQAQAIRFEARKYVPFKLEKIKSDFKILVSSKNRKTMDVFFIAATKERLDAHANIFKDANLQVSGIDIIPFALLRVAMADRKTDAKETIAIVYTDSDRENLSIHIMESGMPFMSRDIRIDADDKDTFFDKVSSELRVSIDYYCGQKPKHHISKIILCGEKFFEGLDAYVSDELKIITENLYSFSKIKNQHQAAVSAIIAIGTSMGGLIKTNYSVDLSPFTTVLKKKRSFDMMIIAFFAAVAIIALTYFFSNAAARANLEEFEQAKRASASLSGVTSLLDYDQLLMQKQEASEYLRFLLLANQRTLLVNKLSAIAKHVTTKGMQARAIWLREINFKELLITKSSKYPSEIARELLILGSAFVTGLSPEIDYINMFYESLKTDKDFMRYFTEIGQGSIERSNTEEYWISEFAISASSHKISDEARERSRRQR
jgi:Tfp pilus assembly PilM family ATPase